MKPHLTTFASLVPALLAFSELFLAVNAECLNRADPCDPNTSYFSSPPLMYSSKTVKSIFKTNTALNLTMEVDSNGKTINYLLVKCGCPAPKTDNQNATVIHVPVGSMLLEDLNAFSRFEKLIDRKLGEQQSVNISVYAIQSIDDSQITMYNGVTIRNRNNLDFDKANLPDVAIVSSGSKSSFETIPTFIDTASLETSELGKAGLIKLYGVLLGMESKAQFLYDEALTFRNYEISTTSSSSSPSSGPWKVIGIIAVIVVASIVLIIVWKRWSRKKVQKSWANKPDDEVLYQRGGNPMPVLETTQHHRNMETNSSQYHSDDSLVTNIAQTDPPIDGPIVQHHVDAETHQHVLPAYTDIEFTYDEQ